jgi:DNA-binding transcriptional ArsR family regulator
MVKYKTKSLDATFGALADATRRAILARLMQGEARVTDLAAPFSVSLPAISKQLRVLENADLLFREKNGRIHWCRLEAAPLQAAAEWLALYQRHWKTPSTNFGNSIPQDGDANRVFGANSASAIFPLTKSLSSTIFNHSVKLDNDALDATFSALADATRRAMLICLAFTESSITELAAPFNMSLPAFLKHLRVLEEAGLVAREKHGRVNLCRLVAAPMQDVEAWIDRYRVFWEKQFDALATYLKEPDKEET